MLLAAPGLQAVGAPDRTIDRVAIVCGAGDDFVGDAARAGADVLLTGEARFHRGHEAESLGLALVVAGHHATERPGVVDLAERLAGSFPSLVIWASRREADPLWPSRDAVSRCDSTNLRTGSEHGRRSEPWKKNPREVLGVEKIGRLIQGLFILYFGHQLTATDSAESLAPALPPRVVGTAR